MTDYQKLEKLIDECSATVFEKLEMKLILTDMILAEIRKESEC